MTQSTYLTHLRKRKLEPLKAARLRGKIKRLKRAAAGKTEVAERLDVKLAVYAVNNEWWRMVRG